MYYFINVVVYTHKYYTGTQLRHGRAATIPTALPERYNVYTYYTYCASVCVGVNCIVHVYIT